MKSIFVATGAILCFATGVIVGVNLPSQEKAVQAGDHISADELIQEYMETTKEVYVTGKAMKLVKSEVGITCCLYITGERDQRYIGCIFPIEEHDELARVAPRDAIVTVYGKYRGWGQDPDRPSVYCSKIVSPP